MEVYVIIMDADPKKGLFAHTPSKRLETDEKYV